MIVKSITDHTRRMSTRIHSVARKQNTRLPNQRRVLGALQKLIKNSDLRHESFPFALRGVVKFGISFSGDFIKVRVMKIRNDRIVQQIIREKLIQKIFELNVQNNETKKKLCYLILKISKFVNTRLIKIRTNDTA